MRSRLVTLVGLLQAAAILTIAFSMVTLLPADFFALQLFSHFRLQYLVVSVLEFALMLWLYPLVLRRQGRLLRGIAVRITLDRHPSTPAATVGR